MKDQNDHQTADLLAGEPLPKRRGRPPMSASERKSTAQRSREYRERKRLELARLRAIAECLGPCLDHPPKVDRYED